MTDPLPFYSDCVDWPAADVGRLRVLIDRGVPITRATLLRHVDRTALAALERRLGYAAHPRQGLTMAGDWHVGYHRHRGIYWFSWSRIEHVFATAAQIAALPAEP